MANFSINQSFTSTGLCTTLVATDSSDYSGATVEGVLPADVVIKTWTFRDSSGTIIKTETGNGSKYTASCAISLLTLNVTVSLVIYINNAAVDTTYFAQNGLLIPCLRI